MPLPPLTLRFHEETSGFLGSDYFLVENDPESSTRQPEGAITVPLQAENSSSPREPIISIVFQWIIGENGFPTNPRKL